MQIIKLNHYNAATLIYLIWPETFISQDILDLLQSHTHEN